jgi:hypothetical protein
MNFNQAEKEFKRLKIQFEAEKLTEAEFKSELEELMVQDEAGTWWMIGYETEKWYRNDGEDWVQAEPPVIRTQEPVQTSDWADIFSITLAWAMGGAIGGTVYWEFGSYIGTALAGGIAWGIGGLVAMLFFHKDQIVSNWKRIGWVALVWAASGAIGWTVGEAITEASGATIGAAAGGALAGAITLRDVRALIDWKKLLWITLAWALGLAVGWTIGRFIQSEYDGAIGWPIGRGIAGGIGGFVTIWQIKKG